MWEGGAEVGAKLSFFSIFILQLIYHLVWEWIRVCALGVWCVCDVCTCMADGSWFGGGRLVVRTSIFSKRSLCFSRHECRMLSCEI